TFKYKSTVYIPKPSRNPKGQKWTTFTPPATTLCRRYRGRVLLRRSQVVVDEAKAETVTRDKTATEFVGERLSLARWLRRAVEHRNQTILMVGAEIVRRQAAFLEKGPAHIVPMTLKDVAEKVGVHESTVSRVTTGMLIVTPQGTFGLKTFFSTALSTDGDEASSSAAIRHRVQQLVKDEDPAKPLSDDAIAKIITDEGTHLARRTVAKYREMLKIPSSFQRKRRAKLAN
ncbi:hypothetical protein AB9K37_10160, partial [Donghicola sp. XS_ASV15]